MSTIYWKKEQHRWDIKYHLNLWNWWLWDHRGNWKMKLIIKTISVSKIKHLILEKSNFKNKWDIENLECRTITNILNHN